MNGRKIINLATYALYVVLTLLATVFLMICWLSILVFLARVF